MKLRKDFLDLYFFLRNVQGSFPTKFAYFVGKNLEILEKLSKEIEKTRPVPDPSYENERIALIEKYAERDPETKQIIWADTEKGEPKFTNVEELKAEMKSLFERHQSKIEDFRTKSMEYDGYMNAETDLVLYTVEEINLPKEIQQNLMNKLIEFKLIISE